MRWKRWASALAITCRSFFTAPIRRGLTEKWARVAAGEPVDWDDVFAGYAATVDWPSCRYYRELAERYPEARVILTERDPDRWFDSTQATIFREHTSENLAKRDDPWARMVLTIVNRNTFNHGQNDRAIATRVFREHNAEVRRTIPAERLLEYQVSDGWQPLCAFLGVPVPAEPFPTVNTTEEFQARRSARDEEQQQQGGNHG